MEEKLIYNSIIVYNYLQYIKYNYPQIDREQLLRDAAIESWETDPGHWFPQSVVNRFYEVVLNATANNNIAREAGRFAAIAWPDNFLREMALSFLSPSNFYGKLGKAMPLWVKAFILNSKRISENKYEVSVEWKEGVKPEKFQCENLMGYLEAISLVYHKKLPIITHEDCFFNNSERCIYIISVARSASQILSQIKFFFLLCLIPSFFIFNLFDLNYNYFAIPSVLIFFIFSYFTERFEKKTLLHTFGKQKLKHEDIYRGYSKYYEDAIIVKKAALSLSRIKSIPRFISRLRDIFINLGLDSGVIAIVNHETDKPCINKIYVFNKKYSGPINLSLDANDLTSISRLTFELETAIFRNPDYFRDFFPPRLMEICKVYEKIIFAPLISDNTMYGFIILEKNNSFNLRASQLFLIDAIASHAALALTNIFYFSSLLETESSKNDFLTAATHELFTPIQIANAAIHIIKTNPNYDITDSIEILDQALSKLSSLGKNLIDLSHNDIYSITPAPIKFNQFFSNIEKECNAIAETFEHKITYSIKSFDTILCNEKYLSEAIVSLTHNAAKYTPIKGQLNLYAAVNKSEFIISITDNGIGIPQNFQKSIFLKFFQIKPNSSGSGVGLYFCSRVVKSHGGYITVKSPIFQNEDRKGTEMTIHLPVSIVS